MLELEAALQRILSVIRPPGTETVPVREAAGRVLAEQSFSTVDLPLFDNSAMDGYAVRALDLTGASPDHPIALRLNGRAAAGEVFSGAVEPGTCVRVFTGSPLPGGADAVVMQEDTRPDPAQSDRLWCLGAVKPWENVRLQGEDLKRGANLATVGSRLTAGQVALLAATGIPEIKVARRPRVSLVATGNELVEPGTPIAPGKIYESNRVMLATLLQRAGAIPKIFPLVPDTLEATRAALEQAVAEGDAVVTSGGVSVGECDLVKDAFEKLGGQLEFWKIALRPGKPFVFGRRVEKFLFGLPGNPVSALVTFQLLVRPALAAMQGAADLSLPKSTGVLTESLVNPADRRHFMRVIMDEAGRVRLAGTQASHSLSSLANANGLVEVPPGGNLPAGLAVTVLRLDW